MPYDKKLAARITKILAGKDVTERKMFGGIAYMTGGNMAVGIVRDELMVRVGPDGFEDTLAQPHARPMDFTGRPMKGMVYVGTQGIAKDADLRKWVERGLKYASSLPSRL